MKRMQKKCEKLERRKKKLEQEVVNLKSHIDINIIEHSQVEQKYKQEIEKREIQDLVEKLKEINLFLLFNLLIGHVLEFTFTVHYISDVYSLCVSSTLVYFVFVDFWKEGWGHVFSLVISVSITLIMKLTYQNDSHKRILLLI